MTAQSDDNESRSAGSVTDPERLAMLLEGKLRPEERAKILAELENAPETRELLADAAAAMGEMDAGATAAEQAIPLWASVRPRFYGRRLWFAAAAVLVFAVSVPLVRSARAVQTLPDVGALVQTLEQGAINPPQWQNRPWREFRGAGQPLSQHGRAIRIGALLADLELLTRARDTSVALIASQLAGLLDEYPGGSAAGDSYRAIANRGPVVDSSERATARRGAESLAGIKDVRLGAWLEMARLAAARRDSAFFDSPTARTAIRLAISSGDADPVIRAAAVRLSAALETSQRSWAAIVNAVDGALASLAN